MSEYNMRQYESMLKQIEQYRDNRIGLKHLIDGLNALLDAVEGIDPDWKASAQSALNVMERAYANMLYKHLHEVSEEERPLVQESIQKMESLVKRALQLNEDQ